jgi:hypothetical protein
MTCLQIVLLDSLSCEALEVMLIQGSITSNLLYETNHGFSALRVERGIGARLDHLESTSAIGNWVVTNVIVHGISEVCDEPHSVAELNSHCLIVDGTPGSGEFLSSVTGSGNEVVEKLYAPLFTLRECKFVILSNNLYFVWVLMGAEVLLAEDVHS